MPRREYWRRLDDANPETAWPLERRSLPSGRCKSDCRTIPGRTWSDFPVTVNGAAREMEEAVAGVDSAFAVTVSTSLTSYWRESPSVATAVAREPQRRSS